MNRRFVKRSNKSNAVTRADATTADKVGKVIKGYAAVFYNESDPATQFQLWENTYERIRPGAFNRAIAEAQDVRGLFNHSDEWVLGRTTSGTCRLSVDDVGLAYEIDESANDPQWVSVANKIERGDIDGSSFCFVARNVTWQTITDAEGVTTEIRWINDCDLYDVGPVTFPAYQATSSSCEDSARSSGVNLHERRELEKEKRQYQAEIESVYVRCKEVCL